MPIRLLARQAQQGRAKAQLPEGELRAQLMQASARLLMGQPLAARQVFEAVLQAASRLQLLGPQLRCHTGLGQVALARGETSRAATAFQAAVTQLETQWRVLPGDELRSAFAALHAAPYQGLLALELARHEALPGPAQSAQVLRGLDNLQARALACRLQRASVLLPWQGQAPALRVHTQPAWPVQTQATAEGRLEERRQPGMAGMPAQAGSGPALRATVFACGTGPLAPPVPRRPRPVAAGAITPRRQPQAPGSHGVFAGGTCRPAGGGAAGCGPAASVSRGVPGDAAPRRAGNAWPPVRLQPYAPKA